MHLTMCGSVNKIRVSGSSATKQRPRALEGGGSCIGNALDASVRISASLSVILTLWQTIFVV
jgi:hypothetical protein